MGPRQAQEPSPAREAAGSLGSRGPQEPLDRAPGSSVLCPDTDKCACPPTPRPHLAPPTCPAHPGPMPATPTRRSQATLTHRSLAPPTPAPPPGFQAGPARTRPGLRLRPTQPRRPRPPAGLGATPTQATPTQVPGRPRPYKARPEAPSRPAHAGHAHPSVPAPPTRGPGLNVSPAHPGHAPPRRSGVQPSLKPRPPGPPRPRFRL